MIPREAASTLERLADVYPVVVLVGPRQSGKTTLAKATFRSHQYVSLESPDTRRYAMEDPRSFLGGFTEGVIIDEAQRVPELFNYLQAIVDASPRAGQFVLTGSSQLGLRDGVNQSLAGRAGHLVLLPLSYGELLRAKRAPAELVDWLFRGGYPVLYDRIDSPRMWLDDYLLTYVERDVRQIMELRHLQAFQQFVALCAGHIGQQVDLTRLGGACGVSHNTAREWLSVLEASFLIFQLRPYHANFRKRLTKTPKLYFVDTGLAIRLLGITEPSQIRTHFAAGALFENWVVSEFYKTNLHHRLSWDLSFFRTYEGLEVDLLVRTAERLFAIEAKLGATYASDWAKSLLQVKEMLSPLVSLDLKLVYGGDMAARRGDVDVVPWQKLPEVAKAIAGE